VAAAILEAAVTPTRDMKVGLMAALDVMLEKIVPALADQVAVLQVPRQQRDEAPQDTLGNLHHARGDGIVYGRGS
jgi:hypothetical protein